VFVGNGILLAYVRDTEIGLSTSLPNHEDHDSDFMRGLDFEESWAQVLEGRCKEGFFYCGLEAKWARVSYINL